MKSVALTAYPRSLVRRAGSKKLRSQDRVPVVIYGRHHSPQNLEVTLKDLDRVIHHSVSENVLLDLEVQGDTKAKRLALVQDVQHHPLSGSVLHVDLHEVVETEKVTITVPVEATGEAVGVKTSGGVLEHVMFKVKVRALPKDLPEILHVDVSHLDIGNSIHLGDIPLPAGAEVIGDKKRVVLSVAAPVTEAQETAAAATATEGAAQPEMIKEKKDETGAAPAAAGDKPAPEKKAEKKK